MIRDRDRIYGAVVRRRLRAMGIRDRPTTPASFWQNGFAERLIGSIRRECLDHITYLGEAHLRRILKFHVDYYNGGQNASIPEQGYTDRSSDSADRCHNFKRPPWRTSPPILPGSRFSAHTGKQNILFLW
jgi:transposase InsO family protein